MAARIVGAAIIERLRRATKPATVQVLAVMAQGRLGTVAGLSRVGGNEQGFCHAIEFSSVTLKTIASLRSYAAAPARTA